MPIKTLLINALILLLFPAMATAFQGYVQIVPGGGSIAWGDGELSVNMPLALPGETAEVVNPALAVRKAATSARKHLLDMVHEVRIDSRRTVSSYLAEDAQLASRVRGVIQNSPFSRPGMFDEEGEVTVSERLRDKLAELVLPTTIPFQSGIPPRLASAMEQSPFSQNSAPQEAGAGAAGYTGVIIDARGLGVTPALTPVVFGQDGVGAYGAFLVSRASAIRHGVAAYADTADAEALVERVGGRPLSVRALSAYGPWRTDVVVSAPMARLVRGVMERGQAAELCRLVIVVDPPVVEEESMGEEGIEPEAAATDAPTTMEQ